MQREGDKKNRKRKEQLKKHFIYYHLLWLYPEIGTTAESLAQRLIVKVKAGKKDIDLIEKFGFVLFGYYISESVSDI